MGWLSKVFFAGILENVCRDLPNPSPDPEFRENIWVEKSEPGDHNDENIFSAEATSAVSK